MTRRNVPDAGRRRTAPPKHAGTAGRSNRALNDQTRKALRRHYAARYGVRRGGG